MSNEQSTQQGNAGRGEAQNWVDETTAESAGKEQPSEHPGDAPEGEQDGAGDSQEAVEAEAGQGEAQAADETSESLEETIARLQQELEQARGQVEDYKNRLMRAEADKENIRKRAEKDVDTARKQSLEKFANELLAVRDSLEMGVEAAQQDDADVTQVREGTELTLRMLAQAMEKFSIEEINPEGEKFNPDLHQAMSMQEVEGYEANTVISVMQKGYRLGDRLLRPALVMVAK
jgi:molecular chaperone GrpE